MTKVFKIRDKASGLFYKYRHPEIERSLSKTGMTFKRHYDIAMYFKAHERFLKDHLDRFEIVEYTLQESNTYEVEDIQMFVQAKKDAKLEARDRYYEKFYERNGFK